MRDEHHVRQGSRLEWVYAQPPLIRVVVLWLLTLGVLFASFALHLWVGSGYEGEIMQPIETESVAEVLVVATPLNLANAVFIGLASLLFRFGPVNPGTLYLIVLVVFVGRIAGLNAFEYPMESVSAGLAQFARVGLWEVTAYVIVGAVTMTKARWIADRPFAQTWCEKRRWHDIEWDGPEIAWLSVAVLFIIGAAIMEGVTIAARA